MTRFIVDLQHERLTARCAATADHFDTDTAGKVPHGYRVDQEPQDSKGGRSYRGRWA
jgi:hypothetical protein